MFLVILQWLIFCLSLATPFGLIWCCCTNNCLIFEDTFVRADSTTVGNGWTERVGDWQISSNTLLAPATSGAIITQVKSSSFLNHDDSYVEFNATNGDQIALIISYNNSTNYKYILVNVAASGAYIEFRQNVAGVDTLVGDQKPVTCATGSHSIRMCNNGNPSLQIALLDDRWGAIVNITTGANTATGIYIKTSSGTPVTITYFKTTVSPWVDPACPSCGNCNCAFGDIPTQWKISIPAFGADLAAGCDDPDTCASMGDYDLYIDWADFENNCYGDSETITFPCDVTTGDTANIAFRLTLEARLSAPGQWEIGYYVDMYFPEIAFSSLTRWSGYFDPFDGCIGGPKTLTNEGYDVTSICTPPNEVYVEGIG